MNITDLVGRWFSIGRRKFDEELNIVKILRGLRNLKLLAKPSDVRKAQLVLEPDNIIAVDSEDIRNGNSQKNSPRDNETVPVNGTEADLAE